MWWHESDAGTRLICDLCPRHCVMRPGERGFCFVRENRDGRIVSTTYGRSTGFCIDPIEKKPLNQFYPGTAVLSFGTPGCNLGCTFCQNWTMSRSRDVEAACVSAAPHNIAEAARQHGCRSVAFTYNDPIIWAEYAIDTACACHALGVKTVAVTSGYITDVARADFFGVMDAANVDLKGFTEEFYRQYCAGHLQPVLDTLSWLAHEAKTWVEITNLVIPGANDSPAEIEQMCQWIVTELGPDVPLHFSAFHPDFKLTDRPATPPAVLLAAHDIARQSGLRYVYTGNVFDPEHQHTYCPGCGRTVIRRDGYAIEAFELHGGRCAHCQAPIAGRFDESAGAWGGRRMPVRIGP
jgi:pyruvate formate lyase activating enzyme